MKSDRKVWELRWKLFKMKYGEVAMQYMKILIMAIVEIIAELYNSKNGKGG